jgi:hypothetical protein
VPEVGGKGKVEVEDCSCRDVIHHVRVSHQRYQSPFSQEGGDSCSPSEFLSRSSITFLQGLDSSSLAKPEVRHLSYDEPGEMSDFFQCLVAA